MITGPRGVGKKMLVHTICTETGSILFDLTPSNIATKYPGKAGLNMLLHMVFKVAKHWPPGVVHINECERTWVKKIPKTDKVQHHYHKFTIISLFLGGLTCQLFSWSHSTLYCLQSCYNMRHLTHEILLNPTVSLAS